MNRYHFTSKKTLSEWYVRKNQLVSHFASHTCRIKMREWRGWFFWDIITGRGGCRERIVARGRSITPKLARLEVVIKLGRIT